MRTFIRILLLVGIAAAIVYCIHSLGTGNLTPRESGLLSIVLTGLSILASWAVSDMYSTSQHKAAIEEVQEAHRTNLRTYALKAAEKVTNLSNELSRLSTYLQQELDYTDYRNTEEELQAKEERLESAIHLVATLKSVNDTSLSDWQGVIGDELAEQREEMHEREEEWRRTLMELEAQLARQNSISRAKSEPSEDTRAEMEALRREIRLAASAITGVSIPYRRLSSRPMVELPCPKCGTPLTFKQPKNANAPRGVRCRACDARLVARYDEPKGSYLTARTPEDVKYDCPRCGTPGTIALDPVPSGVASGACKKCGQGLTFIRATDGVRIRSKALPGVVEEPISEAVIERVRTALPKQPWPTGVHRDIAEQLGIPVPVARRSIEELIKRGDFCPQDHGVVQYPDQQEAGESLKLSTDTK